MLAIAAELDYEVFMRYVQTAFLNADVEENVFAKMALGYEIADKSGAPLVMKLKKSLYGLRQSPRNWFGMMDHHLAKIGSRPLQSDPCIYVFEDDTGFAILTLYVNDVLLLGANKQLLNKLKKQRMDRFEMMLGMNVARDHKKGKITIDQKDYTEDIVEHFGMSGCNPVFTPGAGPELSLTQLENNLLDEEGKRRYQSIVGATMYLAQVSRYDILYAVNQLARGMSKPSKAYMGAAKHLLATWLAPPTSSSPTSWDDAFSDANWGDNPDNAKSTSSYIIMLADGRISFKVGPQGLTAQSTMEVELVAAALTMEESVFCKSMMQELGFKDGFDSVPLFIDNTSALHVAENRTYSPRAKHIELRYFFVQELVKAGTITILYVKTQDQIADLGAKHLNKQRHRELITKIRDFGA